MTLSSSRHAPVAVVTGAARGIGAATVDVLVAHGWRVVAMDRCSDEPLLEYPLADATNLSDLADRHRDRVVPYVGDVRDQADVAAAVELAGEKFGGLDAAVAVAGVIAGGRPVWELDDERWKLLFDVNVSGVWHLARAAVPALLAVPKPRAGRFVAVASAAGSLGLRRLAAYGASKHAVIGLVRGLAADLSGTGVTANVVCPGSTRSAMLEASARIYGIASADELGAQQLLERVLEAEEPAQMIAWLCSPEASAVTGAALAADGGLTTS